MHTMSGALDLRIGCGRKSWLQWNWGGESSTAVPYICHTAMSLFVQSQFLYLSCYNVLICILTWKPCVLSFCYTPVQWNTFSGAEWNTKFRKTVYRFELFFLITIRQYIFFPNLCPHVFHQVLSTLVYWCIGVFDRSICFS